MIYTIGHSTHPFDEFVAMLTGHGVERVFDVRTIPRSRRNPQYNRDVMPPALAVHGIAYEQEPRLGGLRHPRKDSINSAWRNDSFRGYADHMATPEFEAALERLIADAERGNSAVMCAEAVPWRCHRSLIADALTARGVPVAHIMSAALANPHKMTPFARIDGARVTYPGLIVPLHR